MFKKVLVAVDGNEPAWRAVDVAVDLVKQVGGQIGVLHVADTSRAFMPDLGITDDTTLLELQRLGGKALDSACARIPAELKPLRLLAEGEPAEMIITTARDWNADFIVVGNDSRGRLAHFLLGSTADAVVRRAPCPVMTVRANAATTAATATTGTTAATTPATAGTAVSAIA